MISLKNLKKSSITEYTIWDSDFEFIDESDMYEANIFNINMQKQEKGNDETHFLFYFFNNKY